MAKYKEFYKTLAEASAACVALKIKTLDEYMTRRHEDPLLPQAPHQKYKDEWRGFSHYLGKEAVSFLSYEDAQSAALGLGVKTAEDYARLYKKNYRLPSRPDIEYKLEWESWGKFLEKLPKYDFYEARNVAHSCSFRSANDYRATCLSIDDRFHTAPQLFYPEWTSWNDYLNIKEVILYTFEEAKSVARSNSVKTYSQYHAFRKSDGRLPSNPNLTYKKHWTNWRDFLGVTKEPYEEYLDAKNAVAALGISSSSEYSACYAEDPRLPKNPAKFYEASWEGWELFLGSPKKYSTIEEASSAARSLSIKSKFDYSTRYSEDPLLPKCPDIFYHETWGTRNWRTFLFEGYYETIQAAGAAARKLGIYKYSDYSKLRKSDARLPWHLQDYYKEFKDWESFILPEQCNNLEDVKFVVKALNIKDSLEYREQQRNYSCLPSSPDRDFKDEWIDWFDLCDIIQPYSYEEATERLHSLGIDTSAEYKKYITRSGDRRFPLAPGKVYDKNWLGWPVYLGKAEPYVIRTLRGPYQEWQPAITSFLRAVRGATVKENYLVRFVRDFLEPRGIGTSPTLLFTIDRFKAEEFKLYIESNKETLQRKIVNALKQFSVHFIENHLSIKDEWTNESVIIEGARDPFASFSKELGQPVESSTPGETIKPCLAYHFVAGMRNWIIPEGAKTFSDLKHLHAFEADWYEVDESLIDPDDPDCVYKVVDGKYKIWFPAAWMHTFSLSSVPLRGTQIAYVDSGEGDDEIPVLREGKIKWIKNPNKLRGKTNEQGFIKKYPRNEIGMHVTTNKTSRKRTSYDVPWIPEALAIWTIRLRDWQSKYNPIRRAMPWIECRYTNFSEVDLSKKGSNCFLYREFGEEECSRTFSSRLHNRLAIALYNSQPKAMELATVDGDRSRVTSYKSIYTPHTMRVSLITAYVMEFRLPIEMVVKIAGHSSVVMTIYYVKINQELMRLKFTEAEKRALSDKAKLDWQKIQQGRMNEIQHQLVTNNSEAVERFSGSISPGSTLFRDYGICPFAAERCSDGFLGEKGKYNIVPAGYLGSENCIRCRHFISGPVFLGGLLSLGNEISLAATLQFDHISEMQERIAELEERASQCRDEQYEVEKLGNTYNETELNQIELEVAGIEGQISNASRKADMYLSDMNAIKRLIEQCQAVINDRVDNDDGLESTQLILQSDHEVELVIGESSFFYQLNEVCENAQIYVSAKAELALATRSQHIDRLLQINDLKPTFFRLDNKQQLAIGNQLTQFMLKRLQSWEKLDAVMEGRLLMRDLPEDQRLTEKSFQQLLSGQNAVTVLSNADAEKREARADFEIQSGKVGQLSLEYSEESDKHGVLEHS